MTSSNLGRKDNITIGLKSFHQDVGETFQTLKKTGDFYDVTLVSDDLQEILAHRIVLSCFSPVFRQLLRTTSKCSTAMLLLKGIKKQELEHILEFMYTGIVSIPQKDLEDFLAVSNYLKLKGLDVKEGKMMNDVSDTRNNDNLSKEKQTIYMPAVVEDKIDILENGVKEEYIDVLEYSLDSNNIPLDKVQEVKLLKENLEIVSRDIYDEEERQLDLHEFDFDDSKPSFNYMPIPSEVDINDDYDETINSLMEKVNSKWYCKVCRKEYPPKNKTHLKDHIEANHTSGFSHRCKKCLYVSANKSALRHHMARHHPSMNKNSNRWMQSFKF